MRLQVEWWVGEGERFAGEGKVRNGVTVTYVTLAHAQYQTAKALHRSRALTVFRPQEFAGRSGFHILSMFTLLHFLPARCPKKIRDQNSKCP